MQMTKQKQYTGTIGWIREKFFGNNKRKAATIGTLAGLTGTGYLLVNEIKEAIHTPTQMTQLSMLEHTINAPYKDTGLRVDYNGVELAIVRYPRCTRRGGAGEGNDWEYWRDKYLLTEEAVTNNLEKIAKLSVRRRTYEKDDSVETDKSEGSNSLKDFTELEFESEKGKITATDYGNTGYFDLIEIGKKAETEYIGLYTAAIHDNKQIFYRGTGYLDYLIASRLEPEGKEISGHFGTVKFDYLKDEYVFTADNSWSIPTAFKELDRMYRQIYPQIPFGTVSTGLLMDNFDVLMGMIGFKQSVTGDRTNIRR